MLSGWINNVINSYACDNVKFSQSDPGFIAPEQHNFFCLSRLTENCHREVSHLDQYLASACLLYLAHQDNVMRNGYWSVCIQGSRNQEQWDTSRTPQPTVNKSLREETSLSACQNEEVGLFCRPTYSYQWFSSYDYHRCLWYDLWRLKRVRFKGGRWIGHESGPTHHTYEVHESHTE